MQIIIVVLVALVVGIASIYATKKEDNPIEEAAEDVIEGQLSLPKDSIDLSPKKKNAED